MKGLPRSFYQRSTDKVAKDLIGKLLWHQTREGVCSGIIVETEAYFGQDDPASHASRGKTPRNAVMFGSPGVAYVYFCYGAHYLMNVVTEPRGIAGAVLIRGIEPVEGIPLMQKRRRMKGSKGLANGPGKLTQAFKIGMRQNHLDMVKGTLVILDQEPQTIPVRQSGRIGISQGKDLHLRFYWEGNPHISR